MWVGHCPFTFSSKCCCDRAAPCKWLGNRLLSFWSISALGCSCSDLVSPTVLDVLDEITCWGLILCVQELLGFVSAGDSHAFEGVASVLINIFNFRNWLIEGIDWGLPILAHSLYIFVSVFLVACPFVTDLIPPWNPQQPPHCWCYLRHLHHCLWCQSLLPFGSASFSQVLCRVNGEILCSK